MKGNVEKLITINGLSRIFGIKPQIIRRVLKMDGAPVLHSISKPGRTSWYVVSEVEAFRNEHMTQAQVMQATGLADFAVRVLVRTKRFPKPVFKSKSEGEELKLWECQAVKAWMNEGIRAKGKGGAA
jgi:predicted DNA-binding transcriptional regulator AlpA